MTIESEIRSLASTLSIGNSGYFNCPKCGRKNKFGITNSLEGILYQCFSASCKLKNPIGGLKVALSKEAISSILNKKPVEAPKATFSTPDYLIDGFASEAGLRMALKYDLLEAYGKGLYRTAYDPRLNRQVFFHYDSEGNIVGAMGRALSILVKPKAYIYNNSIKTPWVIGEFADAVIVEDILSAVKIANIGCSGIALSGTELSLEYWDILKNYKTITICLDKDASIKSLKMKKLVDFYCKDARIVLIEKDFKDMSRDEARKVLS